jgi:hypothetical protein
MRSLAEINRTYEEFIYTGAKEPYRSRKLVDLMNEMEREYKVPAARNEVWESQNKTVIALYRKISMSRSL